MPVVASPLLLLIYTIALMWLLLDVRWGELSPTRRIVGAGVTLLILAANHIVGETMEPALYGRLAQVFMQLPVFLLFHILSRYKGIKIFFALLTTIFLTAPTISLALVLRSLLSLDQLEMLLINILSYLAIIVIVWRLLKPSFNYMLAYGKNRVFWLFSLIPLFHYFYSYLRTGYYFRVIEVGPDFWFGRLPFAIVCVSYILMLYTFRSTREADRMQNERDMLSMQLKAADHRMAELRLSQEQTAALRHDMRHHFAMLDGLLSSGDVESARRYIASAEGDIERITPKRYCENSSASLILSSFAERARRRGVLFSVEADIPATTGLSDTELCALLSNGLENAVEAASSCPAERERLVRVSCRCHRGKLLILIRNSYDGGVVMKNGLPQSSRYGHGFGTMSIAMLVERQGGDVSFEAADGIFTLKIVLPLFSGETGPARVGEVR